MPGLVIAQQITTTMLAEAIAVAKRSPFRRHRTGAVITVGGSGIVANGWSHVPTAKLSNLYSLHAELHALARGRHLNLQRKRVPVICWVATLTKIGRVTIGKPCLKCAISLRSAGVDTCVYTIDEERYEVLDLEEELHAFDLKLYASPSY